MFAAFEDGILDDGFVLIGAEDETDGGIVVGAALEVVEHSHIHVDLADVLMGEFGGLEVDDDEAFQDVVVEDEIEVEVAGLGADAHLAGDEGEAMAHFQQEALELGDDGGLDFRLGGSWLFRQTEEFQDVGIFDEVADGRAGCGWLGSFFRGLGGEQALVAAGLDLALELTDAPVLRFCLLEVVETDLGIFLSHNQTIMAPCQKATQCVAFFLVREREVEFPEILEVGERDDH